MAFAFFAAFVLILWFGREATFTIDELAWVSTSPDLSLSDALGPHVGHLVLVPRLTYKVMLEVFGSSYVPFRVLTALMVMLTSFLVYVYARRQVGAIAAAAPVPILLLFGSDQVHVIAGNGYTVLLALSCGFGALLALDRRDRRGDLLACALLCVGIATYTVALAFVVGAAVTVLAEDRSWRRLWIAAIPTVAYAIWWLWARGQGDSSQDQLVLDNILVVPSWSFAALSAALEALSGLSYPFTADPAEVGPVLAVAVIVGAGWRLSRRPVPAALLGAIGVAVTLWAMQALTPTILRSPETARYLYPGAVAAILVIAAACSGLRPTRPAIIALASVAIAGTATNFVLLRDASRVNREVSSPGTRADLGALELASANADPGFNPAEAGPDFAVSIAFGSLAKQGEEPLGSYIRAVDAYGSIGFSPEELTSTAEPFREQADTLLTRALDIELAPAASAGSDCQTQTAEAGIDAVVFEAPSEGVVLTDVKRTAAVSVSRFADEASVDIGALDRGDSGSIEFPEDSASQPWKVIVDAPSVSVCRAPAATETTASH